MSEVWFSLVETEEKAVVIMLAYEEYEKFNKWFWTELEEIINNYEEEFGLDGRKKLREKFSSIGGVECTEIWMVRYKLDKKNNISYQFTLSGAGKIIEGKKKYAKFNFRHPYLFKDERTLHPSDLTREEEKIYKNKLKELLNRVKLV